MTIFRFVLIVSILALSVIASLAILPGETLATTVPPRRVMPQRIIDPCWHCLCPTAEAQLETESPCQSRSQIESTPQPCVLVHIKGPNGIRAITCWMSAK